MRQKPLQLIVCAVFSAVLILGCGGTRLIKTNVDETHRGTPVTDVLVIVIADKKETRELFEGKFVAQLKAAGVEAVSSAAAIPMPKDLKLEKEDILKVIEANGNDAVIVTHLTGLDKSESFNRTGRHYGGYYSYNGYVYDSVHDTGFYSGHVDVRLQTNLYDVKTEKLLWSGESETKDAKSAIKLIDDLLALVIKELQKNELLPVRGKS